MDSQKNTEHLQKTFSMDNLKLDDHRMKWLTDRTNRHPRQTQMLFELVEGDFDRLLMLEYCIKVKFIPYCPGDKEEVSNILTQPLIPSRSKYVDEYRDKWTSLLVSEEEFRNYTLLSEMETNFSK